MKQNMKVFIPATLGMLTAFGPFVTDFYLPVLPEMTGYFHTTPALASMSLTAGMIGLAAGQLFIGPLTDKYGRKRILVGSMLLFVVASLLCIFSGDIFMFNAMRVLQGLAGAGGIVIAKSMSADMYTGRELASFMALLGAINGIAPVCAPVVGGLMAGVTSWTGVFAVILAVGLVLMVCSMFLPETLQPANRIRKSVIKVYGNLFRVFRNSRFTLSVMAEMACFFMFFAYIASSPFIMQQVYHLSPLGYSLCFGLNALMIGVGAAMATRSGHMPALRRSGHACRHAAACVPAQHGHAPLDSHAGIYLHADMLRTDAAAFDGHSPRQRARQCRCCQCHLRCLRLCCRCPFESACRHWRHNRHFRPRHGMRSRCLPPVYPAAEQQAARRCGIGVLR